MSYILGISCFYHDSAATLLKDSYILNAVQEERFTRIKHDKSFPKNSIEFLLKNNNLNVEDIDHIVFYEKPILKFERLLETYLHNAPFSFVSFKESMPIWIKEKLFQSNVLKKSIKQLSQNKKVSIPEIYYIEHHRSHAGSAFYCSPFLESTIITLDGVGEWSTTTISKGSYNKIEIMEDLKYPNSIGLLYSAFTYYLGFKVNSGEYKVMGLAPYGKPRFKEIIQNKLLQINGNGSFKLNMKYFNFDKNLTMINKRFENLFNYPTRSPDENLTEFHFDMASSIQCVIEDLVLKIVRYAKEKYPSNNLCLAGGVALNCVANGKIYKEKIFKNIWIQPASGDAGGSLGAAYTCYYEILNNKRNVAGDIMRNSYLGPIYKNEEIEQVLIENEIKYNFFEEEDLINDVVDEIIQKNVIGWFQGAAEFGPRALGNRSIIADARSIDMQSKVNLKIKYRESFRPFAPIILEEDVSEWFYYDNESKYMLMVADLKKDKQIKVPKSFEELNGIEKLKVKRSEVPAVTHVDYSARIQTINYKDNALMYKIIAKYKKKTKIPILLNTSFNVRGEPIVNSPKNALDCFFGTEMDTLYVGNFKIKKNGQTRIFNKNFSNKFEKD